VSLDTVVEPLLRPLWSVCGLLFVDGATIAATSTVLVLKAGEYHEPWRIAIPGAAASAAGSAVQLLLLRWALGTHQPWMHRFAPSRERVEAALRDYPSASFLALTVARATPLPDAPLKIVAAVIRYPIRLYALATFLGSVPYFFVLALIGHRFRIPLWILLAAFGAIGAGILLDRLRRRKRSA
jgi:uncharacterized membrane protein YdjX (TVP38/TMEM64 family)